MTIDNAVVRQGVGSHSISALDNLLQTLSKICIQPRRSHQSGEYIQLDPFKAI